jgi:hypothetical protein
LLITRIRIPELAPVAVRVRNTFLVICATFDPAADLAREADLVIRPVLLEAADLIALVLLETIPTAELDAVKATNLALIVAKVASLVLAVARVAWTNLTMDATFGEVPILVAMACLVIEARFADATESVIKRDLIACKTATLVDAAKIDTRACFMAKAKLAEIAVRIKLNDLVMKVRFAEAAARVMLTSLAMTALLDPTAARVMLTCLISRATFADAAAKGLPARLTMAATFGEAADRAVVVCLINTAVLTPAAARVAFVCLRIVATLGDTPTSVINFDLTVWRTARFEEEAVKIGLPCLTMIPTFGEAADLIERGDLIISAAFGDAVERVAFAWRTREARFGDAADLTALVWLTIEATFGLAASSVIVNSVPAAGKGTRVGSNHPITSNDAPE